MTRGIEEIVRQIKALGGCAGADAISSYRDAMGLMLTPQGREFCLRTGYPSLGICRRNKDNLAELEFVRLDAGHVTVENRDCIAIGDTELTFVARRPERLIHIVAMHGAKVHIVAESYAVAHITSIGAKITVSNDGTAKITIER